MDCLLNGAQMETLVDPASYIPTLEADPRGGKTLTSVKHLMNHLPDLQLFKHPHKSGTVCFASTKAINGTELVEYHTRRDSDSQAIEAWIYANIEGHQIYSIPQYYELGRSVDDGFGYAMNETVGRSLEEAGVRFSVRKDVSTFMASKAAILY